MRSLRRSFVAFAVCLALGISGCARQKVVEATPEADHGTAQPQVRPGQGTRGYELVDLPADGAPTSYRATWAVIIGIDQYPGGVTGLEPLLFAVNDAREFRDVLRDEFGYAGNRIRYLTDEKATRAAIQDTFEKWLPAQGVQANDAVLVFYAGHGLIEPATSQGYLAAVDSQAAKLESSCVAVSWLRDQLVALPSRHKLVVLDSCYSGSLFEANPTISKPVRPMSTTIGIRRPDQRGSGAHIDLGIDNLAYYLRYPAFWGMSAGRFTPVADGSGKDLHSIFTATFLNVLKERADSPREDHAFTFRELASQVETRVVNTHGSRQIPNWGRLNTGDGDFLFRPTVRRVTPRESARRIRYARDIRQALQSWQEPQVRLATELLDDQSPQPGEEDLRGFEWRYLYRLAHPDVLTIRGHTAEVSSLAFSPDSKRLASSGADDTVRICSLSSGKESVKLGIERGNYSPSSIAFSPNGKLFAVSVSFRGILLFDAATAQLLRELPAADSRTLLFTSNSSLLITTGFSRPKVEVWSVESGMRIRSIPVATASVTDLAISSDGRRMALANRNQNDGQSISVWDLVAEKELNVIRVPSEISALTLSPDGLRLCACTSGHTASVIVWETNTRKVLLNRSVNGVGGGPSIVFGPDPLSKGLGETGYATHVAFSPDGSRIALGGINGSIVIWDSVRGEELMSFRNHEDLVSALAFAPDGKLLASASGRELKVWDLNHRQRVHLCAPNERAVCVAFTRDGQRSALIAQLPSSNQKRVNAEQRITISEASTGKALLTLGDCPAGATSVTFTDDGRYLVSLGKHEAAIWNALTGQLLQLLPRQQPGVTCIAFSPDRQHVALSYVTEEVRIWDTTSGTQAGVLQGHEDEVIGVAYSPDGQYLASASKDKTVRLWDLRTNKQLHVFRGHDDEVTSVVYGSDGQYLASASKDKTVRLWNVMTGRSSGVLKGHQSDVDGLVFSSDRKRLITKSIDGAVKVWDSVIGREIVSIHEGLGQIVGMAMTADWNYLAIADATGKVVFIDATPLKMSRGHVPPSPVDGPAYVSPLPAPPGYRKPAMEEQESLSQKLRQKLSRPISKSVTLDRGTQLKDALGFFSDVFDVSIVLDAPAFQMQPRHLAESPVHLLGHAGISLDTALQLVLAQLSPSGTYLIRGDYLVVTTRQRASAENEPADRFLREARRKRAQQLGKKVEETILTSAKFEKPMQLRDVVTYIGDVCDLTIVIDERAFKAAAPEVEVSSWKIALPRLEEVRLRSLLRLVLSQIAMPSTYLIQSDYILLTTRERVWSESGLADGLP